MVKIVISYLSHNAFAKSTNTLSAPPKVKLVIPNKISTFVFDNG